MPPPSWRHAWILAQDNGTHGPATLLWTPVAYRRILLALCLPGGPRELRNCLSNSHPGHSGNLGGHSPLTREHPRYGHLQIAAQQNRNQPSHHEADTFVRHKSLLKTHYQSHFATSSYDYHHYRLAYKYDGVDLTLDPDNQRMDWKSIEPRARQNRNEWIMGQWNQYHQALLYGWEQGLKINGE
jgi:hypothetical protein